MGLGLGLGLGSGLGSGLGLGLGFGLGLGLGLGLELGFGLELERLLSVPASSMPSQQPPSLSRSTLPFRTTVGPPSA